MSKKLLFVSLVLFSAVRGFGWTEGELLIWISDNRGYHALSEFGKRFEREMGVPVRVETQEDITNKFQLAAQSGKGPDIFFWAHDRIGEWADAGLLKPVKIDEDFKAAFLPMAWEAVTHRKQIWGYPLALECVSLICNKKLVTGKPPTQLSEFPAFAKELKAKDPKLIAIMWDYTSPYSVSRSSPVRVPILSEEPRRATISKISVSAMRAPSRGSEQSSSLSTRTCFRGVPLKA